MSLSNKNNHPDSAGVTAQELFAWLDHIKDRTWYHFFLDKSSDKSFGTRESKYFYFDIRCSFDTRDYECFCIQLKDRDIVVTEKEAEEAGTNILDLFEKKMNDRKAEWEAQSDTVQ